MPEKGTEAYRRAKAAHLAEGYGAGDILVGRVTGQYPNRPAVHPGLPKMPTDAAG
jgi:hypothetical protein